MQKVKAKTGKEIKILTSHIKALNWGRGIVRDGKHACFSLKQKYNVLIIFNAGNSNPSTFNKVVYKLLRGFFTLTRSLFPNFHKLHTVFMHSMAHRSKLTTTTCLCILPNNHMHKKKANLKY